MVTESAQASGFLRRAAHLLDIDRPQAAIELLERALALRPNDAIILCHFARAFLLLKDYRRTLEYAERASAADPTEEWAFRLQAIAHLGKDKRKSAYACAKTAVQLAPESPDALHMFAQCAHVLDRNEEARVVGDMLLSQFPESTYGHRVIAAVAAHENDLATAAACYEKILELDPTDDDAMQALAQIKQRHKKYGDSVSLLRGAVHIDPSSTLRQGMLRESIAKFALFGQAHERRRSVAAFVAGTFAIYLALFWLVARLFPAAEILYAASSLAFPVVMILAIAVARSRFFASQSAQLKLLHGRLRRGQARRGLLAAAVVIATGYGIATLIYLDTRDASVFLAPLGLIIIAIWVYVIGVTLWLLGLCVSDFLLKLTRGDSPKARRRFPKSWLLPAITVLSFAVLTVTDHWVPLVTFIAGAVLTGISFFRRFPLAAGALILTGGAALLLPGVSALVDSDTTDAHELALALSVVGSVLLVAQAVKHVGVLVQRRRVHKLLGTQR